MRTQQTMNRNRTIPLLKPLLCMSLAIGLQLLMFPTATAQNGFNIPFSQFGAGYSEQPFNLPMVTRTGGIVYTRAGNNYVNPFNPASYASVETESFVFDMGVNMQVSTLRDNLNSLQDAEGNLGYLMVAMPITKWWKVAAGLMPYSTVSYESTLTQTDPVAGRVVTTYSGGDGQGYSGGVNEVFVGSAFNLLNGGEGKTNLQAGFNVHYLTGNIVRAISYSFPESTTTYFLSKRRLKTTTLNNLTFDAGLQLRQPLGSRFTLGVGLVYKPHLELSVNDDALIYTYHNSDESLIDTIFPARGAETGFKSLMEQPQTFGVGLSLERNRRWQVAVDATFAEWSDLKYTEGAENPLFGASSLHYGPYSRYALGFERMGDMDAATYWGRMSWSLGVHTTQGALRLEIDGGEHRLDEWGAGAGVTLPMRKGRSLLTLSAGYSSLGDPNVLQRDTWTFGIAVSSCERWFYKRRFN